MVGISTVIYPVADAELQRFRDFPVTLTHWLTDRERRDDGTSLQDRWRAVADLLTGGGRRVGPPCSALTEGDLRFPQAADRGAHALWAGTVRDLATALGTITTAHIEEEAQRAWAAFATRTARATTLTPAQLRVETAELQVYLGRLRHVTDHAAAAGLGMLLARWEDW
jgi:Domain of unknown function (DUF1877)